ncbi:E3 ubiquitin-protein ligase Pep5p [[Candida] anglica]|uniref:E3 ubiquitin-protein ligase PEP5 n=1 Tax=[Candida] anglica TaxID=148631 RepID=A0ABP0EMV9_9ASCO
MTTDASWRQFPLFDLTPIRDPYYRSPEALYSDPSLSAVCSCDSYLVLAVHNVIKVVAREFVLAKQFSAYDLEYRINYMAALPQSNLVVTVAERQGFPALLKLWDITKLVSLDTKDEDQYKHEYHTLVRINNQDNAFPISSFAFNPDLTCVAVGYANGKVLLIRGDLIRDRGSKQRVIYESPDPVTGIRFNPKEDLLYITTTSRILTVLTTGRNHGKLHRLLSKKTGVDINCSDIDPFSDELIVATSESIRYYNHLNKTHTLALDMPKKYIYRFGKQYLLVVSPTTINSGVLSSNGGSGASKVVVLDLTNNHISFTLTIPNSTINHVFSMWGDIYMLSNDGVFFKIHEKPINQQIEIILQRNLYLVAYQLAEQASLPKSTLLRIQKLHGTFLFENQNFEESIDVYIQCLDLIDSTATTAHNETLADFIMDIVTKFKDVSNINNLSKFLFRLYELKLADNDHLTLLLCCYCKLKKLEDLDTFIDELDLETTDNSSHVDLQELNFQLIINLFKECGYYTQVIKLLYKLNQPGHIVDIQLNYLNQPQKCLQYIKTLSIDDLLLILIDYSKYLLDNLPIETTELLINVFTGHYVPQEQELKPFEATVTLETNGHDDSVNEENEEHHFPINSYKNFLTYISLGESSEDQEEVSKQPSSPTYLPPRPTLIFPSFTTHPNEFVVFLEACVEAFDRYQGNINDKTDLLMTLYEMYLTLGSQKDASDEWSTKAKQLVDTYSTLFNKSSLLLVSHVYGFHEGELVAKEQSGFEESLFRSSAISGNVEDCFKLALKYGDTKPELYKLLLKFIVSKVEIFNQVSESDFRSVLQKIKAYKLASPLEVVQILSTTEFTTIGLVKDYLIEYIDTQNREISNNHKLINSYEKESTKYGLELSELTSKPFVIQNNKCSACKMKLDFPMLHFKCGHSYHQRCLEENVIVSSTTVLNESNKNKDDRQCPLCADNLERIRDIRDRQYQSKEDVAMFEQSLKNSDDRFKVVSDYFGKGVMENETTVVLNQI